MKKPAILLAALLSPIALLAQEVISTQGDSYSNSSGRIAYTIGEVVINTETNGTHDVTQGFHQTNWVFVGVEDYAPAYEAAIYPNPAEDALNIKAPIFEDVRYVLYDAGGQVAREDRLTSDLTFIDLGQLAPGSYTLSLYDEAKNLKTFKLIKTR